MKKNKTKRGHRYWRYTDTTNTTTEMRVFKEPPGEPWIKGSAPLSPEVDRTLREKLSIAHKGKPKNELTKLRMSHAKLNRAKSEEHIKNMRKTHQERVARVKELQKRYPTLSYREASKLEVELRKK